MLAQPASTAPAIATQRTRFTGRSPGWKSSYCGALPSRVHFGAARPCFRRSPGRGLHRYSRLLADPVAAVDRPAPPAHVEPRDEDAARGPAGRKVASTRRRIGWRWRSGFASTIAVRRFSIPRIFDAAKVEMKFGHHEVGIPRAPGGLENRIVAESVDPVAPVPRHLGGCGIAIWPHDIVGRHRGGGQDQRKDGTRKRCRDARRIRFLHAHARGKTASTVSPPATWHLPWPPPSIPEYGLFRSKRQRMRFAPGPRRFATTLPV